MSTNPTFRLITDTVISSATQYCDGLKGPLVIYDPADPFQALYDIDDGKRLIYIYVFDSRLRLESTVITLSDWYHTSARALAGTVP